MLRGRAGLAQGGHETAIEQPEVALAAKQQPPGEHDVMSEISIHELEAAINFWRARSPSSGDELVLCKEASALSKPYALMIVQRQQTLSPDRLDGIARQAWDSYVRLNNSL
ncbi:hypothetical protein GGD68_004567 [Paraburkholderia fungorum]|jgi:hypothetical protein|uniref:DUF3717 domain-containing protein n=3 Tax=Paraburkholderia TaxID=1822464 RepID=A0AAW3UYR1_9BURK|nr:hypothetical protein [Paraburkholderia fungorum]MBB6203809.1 hypothetical protein [Paraburkholderia fungorum]